MKHNILVLLLPAALLSSNALVAQKKSTHTTAKKAEEYYSESGKPLYTKDVKDKNGKLAERDFLYKDDNKLEHKELYTNSKITEADYYADEVLSFKTTFDDKGKETSTTFINRDGTTRSKSVYTYQPDGQSKTVTYNKDNVKTSEETLDDEQRTLEKIEYKEDGTVANKEVNKFDGKIGQCHKTETTVTDASGNVMRKEIHDHDTKRKETTEYFKNGKMKEYTVEEDAYSINEHYTEMDSYEEDGSYRTQKMQHFKKGRNSGITLPLDIHWYDKDGKLDLRSVSTYTDEGYKTEEDWYDGSGKLKYKDTYTNDANGNEKDVLRTYPDGKTEYTKKDGKDLR